ncbi:hypothetical protein GCM10023081_25070 [Arthrobacter ginkgonis]|uniref:Uncharacterized protein n=1 Tax=Arthrobacter ginkgonis TaxID=1630594 RepID=A0ABP7CG83_9MICC
MQVGYGFGIGEGQLVGVHPSMFPFPGGGAPRGALRRRTGPLDGRGARRITSSRKTLTEE